MTFIFFLFQMTAYADVRFEAFAWRADNSFEVRVSNPQPQILTGTLNDAVRTEVVSGPVTLTAKSFAGSFVVLTLTEAGSEFGQVVVLERQNGRYLPIQNTPISGRASTLAGDLDSVISVLQKMNHWDAPQSLRAMMSYFDASPGKKMNDFFDAAELGHVRMVARPNPKGSRAPRNATGPEPKKTRTSEWKRTDPAYEPSLPPPALPPPPRFETPRRLAPLEAPPEPRRGKDYPGQRINPRPPPMWGERTQRPPPRQKKTLFELLFDN